MTEIFCEVLVDESVASCKALLLNEASHENGVSPFYEAEKPPVVSFDVPPQLFVAIVSSSSQSFQSNCQPQNSYLALRYSSELYFTSSENIIKTLILRSSFWLSCV